jgi:iron-sulfur cluster assembly accessory protein
MMIQETVTQLISVSPAAAQAIRKILAERNLDGYALRVYVSGSSCCGVQFGMALDNNIHDADTAFDTEGIKLVVDNASLEYLNGASIDFVNDPARGAGFVVDSPNAKQGQGEAGCSSSSCGGGSCSCSN